MFKFIASTLLLAIAASASNKDVDRELGYFRGNRSMRITVTNISYQQPMSPFFYMVHNSNITPLFELGEEATDALRDLAENGATQMLTTMYDPTDDDDIASAGVMPFMDGDGNPGPLMPGDSTSFDVTISRNHPFVSFASMAINTNDCFVGVNRVFLKPGSRVMVPGYDSGTEENNELCSSIPGPACPSDSGNTADGGGEGVIHVHRGVHGTGDLLPENSDWRNPMLLVTVSSA